MKFTGEIVLLSLCTEEILNKRNQALIWARALIVPAKPLIVNFDRYWTDFAWWKGMWVKDRGLITTQRAWVSIENDSSITYIHSLHITHLCKLPPEPSGLLETTTPRET